MIEFNYNDGGRSYYYKGEAGDCVTRSIAIATGIDYKTVYDAMFDGIEDLKENGRSKYAKRLRRRRAGQRGTTPRNGVSRRVYDKYLKALGWVWVPTMTIGSGCKVHLRPNELPKGRLIVRVSKHITTMIDGVINDTYDCSREGIRCVYGYYYHPENKFAEPLPRPTVVKVKRTNTLVNLRENHKEVLFHLIDIRRETIEEDPSSADSFETQETLQFLKDKIDVAINPKFSDGEKKWLGEEIDAAPNLSFDMVQKLLYFVNNH